MHSFSTHTGLICLLGILAGLMVYKKVICVNLKALNQLTKTLWLMILVLKE